MIHPDTTDALKNPLWKAHKPGDRYTMDDTPDWEIYYYPLFECGKTGKSFNEPRALVGKPKMFGNTEGVDFREVPLRYLKRQ